MKTPPRCTCGRCGRAFRPLPNARYNSLCGTCRVPHQDMTRDVPDETWRCVYCGQIGTLSMLLSTDCTHDYEKCESCGQHPYCARDCSAVKEILSNTIGFSATRP